MSDHFYRELTPAPGTVIAMTLREHYAGLAMAAVISTITQATPTAGLTPEAIANAAALFADALMAKLAEKPETKP